MNKLHYYLIAICLFASSALSAQQSVNGIVTDDTGNPLPSVSVIVQGTNQGVSTDFDGDAIVSCVRIGKPKSGHRRLLKVKFADQSQRNLALYSQRKIRDDKQCVAVFGRVFVNKDSSPLLRKEEKRLRDKMFRLKEDSSPDCKVYIKSGKLFCNQRVVDTIDIANQLF